MLLPSEAAPHLMVGQEALHGLGSLHWHMGHVSTEFAAVAAVAVLYP